VEYGEIDIEEETRVCSVREEVEEEFVIQFLQERTGGELV